MVPAQQRLRLDDAPVPQRHDGLVDQLHLLLAQGGAQVRAQAHAVDGRHLQRRREITVAVASRAFRHIHGLVRMLEQVFDRARVIGIQGDADRGGDESLLLPQQEWRQQAVENLPGDAVHLLQVVEVGQDHREFIAAQARHRVRLAHAHADAPRRLDQQDVALVVAEGIVDFLEVVEVDEQDGHAAGIAAPLRQRLAQPLVEHAAVRQLRQGIKIGLLPDQRFRLALVRHVFQHAQVVRAAMARRGDGRHGSVDPHDGAIGTHDALRVAKAEHAARQQLRHLLLFAGHVVGMADLHPAALLHVFQAAPGDGQIARIDVEKLSAHGIDQGNAHRRFLEHGAKAQFALADGVFRAAPFARQVAEVKSGRHGQQAARHAQRQIQPAQVGARHGTVKKTLVGAAGRGIRRQQAHGRIGIGDMLPALGIHVARLHQHGLQQQFHLLRLVQQVRAVVALAVAGVDQLRHLFAVRHRILPAAHAGRAESLGPFRIAAQFLLAGKQVVAVKIDAGRARRELIVGKSRPVQVVRFIGRIRSDGLDLAIDQVLDPVAGRQMLHLPGRDAHFLQEQRDFIGAGGLAAGHADHHGCARQLAHVGRATLLAHQQHAGRMLEHHAQHHHGLAGQAAEQQGAVADTIFGPPIQHGGLGAAPGAAFEQRDIQPRLAVIALFDGRVIAGELELVGEIEL
ncbi:hypothetical protein JaAD80_25430 [Janthinobacterium sp. AD80]|nr:hypothetical protein JaAD80_25430 [Janthinobacterium sp. AD80]